MLEPGLGLGLELGLELGLGLAFRGVKEISGLRKLEVPQVPRLNSYTHSFLSEAETCPKLHELFYRENVISKIRNVLDFKQFGST